MDLKLQDKLFIVTGATSGLGLGITERLIKEGAQVVTIARNKEKLDILSGKYTDSVIPFSADLFEMQDFTEIRNLVGDRELHGVVINAGGPPPGSFMETTIDNWDKAYRSLVRWKILLVKELLPIMIQNHYGRIVFVESSTVKQPLENLVLSNSMRLAVVGFVKSLSQEIAEKGVTLNIMAPGFHDTPAVERVFVKRSQAEGITVKEAREKFESEIKVRRLGQPDDFGSLGVWLLSEYSGYITGQTISVDGGFIKGIMG
ncbi:MAG: SDR family oxidoreductase [Bacteroidales bacterium]|nr:SDR family oxidoreductase [Bacteroidales bacterium]